METINFRNKQYTVIEKLKNKKLHVKYNDKDFIIVPFDSYNNFSSYISNYKLLRKNKVEMPKILKKDKKGFMLLEQFIVGEPVAKLLAEDRFDRQKGYNEIFRIYRNNRFAKIALSYKPNNFIKHKKYFYYVSNEIYNFNQSTAFERSNDIYLWMDTYDQKRYCESFGYTYKPRALLKDGPELKKQLALLCVANW